MLKYRVHFEPLGMVGCVGGTACIGFRSVAAAGSVSGSRSGSGSGSGEGSVGGGGSGSGSGSVGASGSGSGGFMYQDQPGMISSGSYATYSQSSSVRTDVTWVVVNLVKVRK